MAVTAGELNDNDILYGYLPEYLDGELPSTIAPKFEQLLQTAGKESVLEEFQSLRGRLQLSMQSYYLRDKEQSELAALVQDPRVKATVENVRIAELERGVAVNTMVRRVSMVVIGIGLVIGAYWQFGRSIDSSFKPLEYLGYEALALEEASHERLNLPSHDSREVNQYLSSYPGLDFKPRMLRNVPSSWELEGATVIDYEIAKVVVVMYDHRTSKNNEKIIHFSFAGRLSDLPRSEPGNMRGLIYQTYASNDQNMVAWQSAPNVVSMLVGRRSADELAEIAVAGHNN